MHVLQVLHAILAQQDVDQLVLHVLLNRHLLFVKLVVSLFRNKAVPWAQCGVPILALQVLAEQYMLKLGRLRSRVPEALCYSSILRQCDVHVLVLQVLAEQHMMKLDRLKSRVPEAQHSSTAHY